MTTLLRTDSDNKDFQILVTLLDKDLREREGDEHAFYAQYNKITMIKNVVVSYNDNNPIGCGAFKKFDDDKVEIKRMYVKPEFRGQGIAMKILSELEKWAAESGYSSTVLETGKRQPEAINLYKKAGYQIIPNFGQYEGVENSVCMMKKIENLKF